MRRQKKCIFWEFQLGPYGVSSDDPLYCTALYFTVLYCEGTQPRRRTISLPPRHPNIPSPSAGSGSILPPLGAFCLRVPLNLAAEQLSHVWVIGCGVCQTPWHPGVLALPSCHVVKELSGKKIFAGPRVRMGIHVANKGTYIKELNKLTKHVQFSGKQSSSASSSEGDPGRGSVGVREPKFLTAQLLGWYSFVYASKSFRAEKVDHRHHHHRHHHHHHPIPTLVVYSDSDADWTASGWGACAGQGVKVASLLGDAANGGQIVMSGEALEGNDVMLSRSGLVLKHLGVYDFHTKPSAVSPTDPPQKRVLRVSWVCEVLGY
eukprot:1176961-Prorocentrum_minimum.AAC.1